MKISKRQVKMVSLAICAFFVLGIVGLAASQSGGGKGYAAAAGNSSNIGVVNYDLVMRDMPELKTMEDAMKKEVDQAQQDFDAKSKDMNDQQKQDYYMQLQQRLNMKKQELLAPVFDKVNAAIKAVADAKGLAVVVDKNNVLYGGQDITDDVVKKLTGK